MEIKKGVRVEAQDRFGRYIVGTVTKSGPADLVTIHDEDSHRHYSVETCRCVILSQSPSVEGTRS